MEWIESLVAADHARLEDFAHAIRTAAVFIMGKDSDGEVRRQSVIHRCRILLDGSER